jgi:ribonucleotide monophosphatase NagD (HAD superfamily)
MGGEVYWAGKPHPSAYATAHTKAEAVRGANVPKARILAIGDAIRTDLKAAAGAGIDALFVTSGIHRAETMTNGGVDADKLARALGPGSPPAIAATAFLDW